MADPRPDNSLLTRAKMLNTEAKRVERNARVMKRLAAQLIEELKDQEVTENERHSTEG